MFVVVHRSTVEPREAQHDARAPRAAGTAPPHATRAGRAALRALRVAAAREAVHTVAQDAVDDAGAGLLDVADTLLDALTGAVIVGDVDDDALRASVARVARLQDRLEADKLRRVAESVDRGLYAGRGRSPADAVARELGCTVGEARQLLDTADALRRMPKTAAALAAGEVSAANAREAARQLLEDERLARLAEQRRRAEQQQRDTAHDDADDDGDGGGLFDHPAGHHAHQGHEGHEGRDGHEGHEGGAGRRGGDPAADAAADAAADIDDATAGAGRDRDRNRLRDELRDRQARHRPDLAEERARRALERRNLWWGPDRRPGNDGLGIVEAAASPELLALLGVAVDADARPNAAGDDRTLGQRRHDVLVEILRRHLDDGRAPITGGVRPHALIRTSAEALHGSPHAEPPLLDGVGPVSPQTARQLCCDSDVTHVAVRNGSVLDLGRRRRLFTDPQRAAIFATYDGCIGCGAPLWRTQIHHVWWWDAGGPTDLANGGPACQGCHTNIHHFGWVVWRDPATRRFTAGPPQRAPAAARTCDGHRPA